jgi:hypothetical protein
MFKFLSKPEIWLGPSGKRNASFNKIQYWLYPEICKEQAKQCISDCPPEMAPRQRQILQWHFPGIFDD